MTPSRFLRIARQRLRVLIHPRDLESEIDRELAVHLELLANEKVADGLPPDAALLAARREFGDVTRLAERSRDVRGLTWLADLRDDVRYGVRMLRRSPGFTTVASLALALGIGAAAAVTATIALVLARPLPFPHGDRIVRLEALRGDADGLTRGTSSVRDFLSWRSRTAIVEQIGASSSGPRAIGRDPGGAPPERVAGQAFTPGLFTTLGVQPRAGRLFEETTDPYSRAALTVVISDRLWQRRYGGAADTIGRQMVVDGTPRRIVGIMGRDFRFQDDNVDLWTPLILLPPRTGSPPSEGRQMLVTARLRPGVTIAQAQAELGAHVRLVPLRDVLYGWTRPRLLTLAAAVMLVLTLACANIAGLLLARGTARRREVAMRIALGATRARIVRQMVTESLVLGLGAGVPGIAVAWIGVVAVRGTLGPPPGRPWLGPIDVDAWVLSAVLLFSLLASVGFGLVPALVEGRMDVRRALTPSSRTAAERRGDARYQAALAAAQVAIAEMLLIGTALLSISYVRLSGRELNLDQSELLTFEYSIRAAEFIRPLEWDRGVPSFEVSPLGFQTIGRVFERLRSLDGAGDVGGISYPPINSIVLPTLPLQTVDAGHPAAPLVAAYFIVTPGLFATLRTPIVRGREFDDRDVRAAPWAIVVNETLARLCWPGGDSIGRHVRLDGGADEQPREVIGVVADVPTRLDQPVPQPVMYASYLQQPSRYRGRAVAMFGEMTFVMRPARNAAEVLAAAREAIADATPERPIVNVGTLQAHTSARLRERRNYVSALAAFGLAAALIAVMGLHGLAAYAVNARTGEIAVRKALGARGRHILAMTGGPLLVIVVAGLLAGLVGALPLTRALASQLWGVTPTDPPAFISVAMVLLCATTLGCLVPLRRAQRVDPAARLRSE